jgi:hypothetical protein
MLYTATLLASLAAFSTAQSLNIPTRSGSIISLAQPSTISGSVDYGNKEFDRGRACDTDADTGSDSAVFILNDGATISNVIIGTRQLEGIHCKGACTLRNVWFRDVCEGALTLTVPFLKSRDTRANHTAHFRRRLRPRQRQRPLARRRGQFCQRQGRPAQRPRNRDDQRHDLCWRRQSVPQLRRLHQQRRSSKRCDR